MRRSQRWRAAGATPSTPPVWSDVGSGVMGDAARLRDRSGIALGGLFHFPGPQYLAVRAIAAHLGPRKYDLEPQMCLDLFPHALQRLAKELLNAPAPQTDHMRVLLLEACLIVVLIPLMMHEVKLIHQAAFLQQL